MSLHTGSLCNLTVGDTCQFRFSLPSHADIQLLGTILERKLKLYPMGNRLLEDILKRGCHLIEGSRFAAVNKFGLFKLSLEVCPRSKEIPSLEESPREILLERIKTKLSKLSSTSLNKTLEYIETKLI